MGNVLDATASVLVSEVGLVLDSTLHLGRLPDDPDVAIGLIEYGGEDSTLVFGDAGIAVDMPRVQIISRGERHGYLSARNTLVQARRALVRASSATYSGLPVLRWNPITTILSLGPDESERPMLSCNLIVMTEEEPAP